MKWLWAAYRRGVFSHLPEFPEGFDPFEFRKAILGALALILQAGGDAWILIGVTPRGNIPVGLVTAVSHRGHLEPSVLWFPEATARNRLECAVKWLHEVKKTHKIDILARPRDWQLFDHLCKYGLLRTIGKYRGHFDDDDDAFIFQSVT